MTLNDTFRHIVLLQQVCNNHTVRRCLIVGLCSPTRLGVIQWATNYLHCRLTLLICSLCEPTSWEDTESDPISVSGPKGEYLTYLHNNRHGDWLVSHVQHLLQELPSEPQFSWAFTDHYSANAEEKMEVELHVWEFFCFLGPDTLRDVGAVCIWYVNTLLFLPLNMSSSVGLSRTTMHTSDNPIEHVSIHVYTNDGHHWHIWKGVKDWWASLHILKDCRLWAPVPFVEKNA